MIDPYCYCFECCFYINQALSSIFSWDVQPFHICFIIIIIIIIIITIIITFLYIYLKKKVLLLLLLLLLLMWISAT